MIVVVVTITITVTVMGANRNKQLGPNNTSSQRLRVYDICHYLSSLVAEYNTPKDLHYVDDDDDGDDKQHYCCSFSGLSVPRWPINSATTATSTFAPPPAAPASIMPLARHQAATHNSQLTTN